MPVRISLLAGRPRLGLALAAVVVLVLAGSGIALAVTGDSGPHYRLAAVEKATIEQELTSVGTVAAVNRATVAFPVSGTVESVTATLGAKVAAGQVLASLATGSLQQQVAAANAGVATARQALATDEASETATATTDSVTDGTDAASAIRLVAAVTPAARPSGAPAAEPTGSMSRAGSSITALAGAVTRDQQRVVQAQQSLDSDLNAAEAALTRCRSDLSQPEPTPTSGNPTPTSGNPTPGPTASGTVSPTATATSSSTAPGSDPSQAPGSADCLAAIAKAPDSARTSADERSRGQAEAALDKAIQALVTAAGKAGTSSGSSSGHTGGTSTGTGSSASAGNKTGNNSGRSQTGNTSGGSGTSGTLSGSGSSSTSSGSAGRSQTGSSPNSGPASAQQLAADQAQIDAATAELAVAEQGKAEAVLTSPLAGTVAAVGITAGKTVSGSSSSTSITVIGAGQEQVNTTVSLADIDSMKVGDQASVRVDGISTALSGKVSSVGILNTTTGTTTSYPVTVVLDPSAAHLYDGSGASVQIRTASVTDVLSVPSSAVHAIGTFSMVTLYNKGKTTLTRITTGATGTDRTQVMSGLSAGQQVVLADLGEPLPSSGS